MKLIKGLVLFYYSEIYFFSDWFSVCEAANFSREGQITVEPFSSTRWMSRQREMLALARIGEYPRPTNLPLLAAASGAEFIVDLGGAAVGLQNFYQNRKPAGIEIS